MRNKRNIGRHELIGLDIEVISATDKVLVGMRGTITDETRNTIIIKKKDSKEARLPKKDTTLRISLEEGDVDIECNRIMFRPEDRIKRVKQ
jgi:ribonuclease P protein subunit POP4